MNHYLVTGIERRPSEAAFGSNKPSPEAAESEACMFGMFLHNRLHPPLPREGNKKKKKRKDVGVWIGVGGSSPVRENAVWAALVSGLFMTHSCWQPLFTSHISYLRRRGSAAYPPHARVCEGSVGGWEGTIIPSVGITCILGGFNTQAVEAGCLTAASGPLFTLSFNYLCHPPHIFFRAKLS